MRTNNTFKKTEVIIIAAVLCVVAAMTLPKFSRAATDERLNTLCENLQTVRSQLSLYHVQHEGQWPRLAAFAEQMTQKTNLKGTTDDTDGPLKFGPYLERIPANPFTGGSSVSGGDWLYDQQTGRFIADDGGATKGIRHKDL